MYCEIDNLIFGILKYKYVKQKEKKVDSYAKT